jgi:hypothetical protein
MPRFRQSDEAYYISGGCPYFAIAAHRITKWPLAILVDEASEYEFFGDREYPTIAHVFVVSPYGDVFDVKGIRSIQTMKDEFHNLIRKWKPDDPIKLSVQMVSLKELKSLMRGPLSRYDAEEVREAEDIINGLFLR